MGIMTGRSIIERGVTQHRADALLVACGDYRFVDDWHKFMCEKGLNYKYYCYTPPGATKGIISPRSALSDTRLDDIATYWRASQGQIRTVFELHHEDCAAYGRSLAFTCAEDERRRHFEDMRVARLAIDRRLMIEHERMNPIAPFDVSYVLAYGHVKTNKTDDYDFEILEDIDGVLGRPTAPPDERPFAAL